MFRHYRNPMKKLSLFLILLFSINSFCQTKETKNIIGIWQAETSEISSTYQDIYRFSKDNKFEFEPTRYNGLNRIIKISGVYKINNYKIIFYPHKITELSGNKIERSMTSTLSDTWAIDNGKSVSKIIKSSPQEATLEIIKLNSENQYIIKIDNRTFYKIFE
jgi:hypothetical protein